MDKKEILEKIKQNILENYELNSMLAPCIKCFTREDNEIDFEIKEDFECDDCLSNTCFVLLSLEPEVEPDIMFG